MQFLQSRGPCKLSIPLKCSCHWIRRESREAQTLPLASLTVVHEISCGAAWHCSIARMGAWECLPENLPASTTLANTHLYLLYLLLTAKTGHVGLPGRGERDSEGILER